MGTLFMVNPPRKKSRKRRTAKQRAATRKMIAARKAKLSGKKSVKRKRRRAAAPTTTKRRRRVSTMARKRAKKRAAPRRRRRSAKRRSPVTALRRHSVYLTNPRRRRRGRRRRSYSRNPALFKQVQQGVMDAGATLVGGAVSRMASGFLPLPKEGLAGVASSLAVALGVGMAARRVVSHDTARFITAGAMQVPVKNLITTFVPGAGAFLGDYDFQGAYALQNGDMGNYLSPGMYGVPEQDAVEIGVYE